MLREEVSFSMAASDNKKKKCQTVIPASWPQLLAPTYRDGMNVDEANRQWAGYLRVLSRVGPTPKVYRTPGT